DGSVDVEISASVGQQRPNFDNLFFSKFYFVLPSASPISSTEAAKRSTVLSSFLNELWTLDENRLQQSSELQVKQNDRKLFDIFSVWKKESKALFQKVQSKRLEQPTYTKFIRLLDNYEMNTTIKEYFTEEKMNETWDFLNAVMETKVMQRTNEFLSTWGFAPKDREQFKAMLFEMWFAFDHPRDFNIFYPGEGQFSSFEHVFVGELEDENLLGFHNWIQLYRKEYENEVRFMKFARKGCSNESPFISITFDAPKWKVSKSGAYFLLGTSPEFELAAYTAVFLFRVPGKLTSSKCPIYLICTRSYYRDWRPSTCYPKDKFF
ncbi:Poly(U)-specific endoribonuclease, partial [Fasciolopsis buskii]